MNNRNKACYCNSGKKYKKCHLYLDQGLILSEMGTWTQPPVVDTAYFGGAGR